jgi:hypothetical protein
MSKTTDKRHCQAKFKPIPDHLPGRCENGAYGKEYPREAGK